jgi:hypothetical protein
MKTLDKIDRFDLEQDIMNCWQVVEDIKTLTKRYLDGPVMSQDEVANVLIGLESLYQIKFEQLFGTFEQCIKNGKLDYDDRLARIDFLQKEIELIKSRFEDHNTGHLRTAVSVLEARVREESGWLVGNY